MFFFNDTATTEIYTLSLHDALPICHGAGSARVELALDDVAVELTVTNPVDANGARRTGGGHGLVGMRERAASLAGRSEEHTSELQSRQYLVCRLLLEKKKKKITLSQLRHTRRKNKNIQAQRTRSSNPRACCDG